MALPVEGSDESKRINKTTMAPPLLNAIEINGKASTADALLTQRTFAMYLVIKRQATIPSRSKASHLHQDLALFFNGHGKPRFVDPASLEDGRLKPRKGGVRLSV